MTHRGDPAKRALDLLIVVPSFIASLPVQAVVAIAVRAKLGSPVLFRQQRPGLNGVPFTLVKFRTMLPVDPVNSLITDGDRLTSFGSFLRSTSLDELPTLWNVLRNDMSLVGPRPLRMEYLDRYSPRQARRHEVRPGITGLAQINGRNTLTWLDRFDLDVEYVEKQTLVLDLSIILKTIKLVILRHGISADNSATMNEFLGERREIRHPTS